MMMWAQFWLLMAAIYLAPHVSVWLAICFTVVCLVLGLCLGAKGI